MFCCSGIGYFHSYNSCICTYLLFYVCSLSFPTTSGSADSIAMHVRQLYQDDLPSMYQRGSCPMGDLQQHPTAVPTPTAAGFVSNPCVLLPNFMLLYTFNVYTAQLILLHT